MKIVFISHDASLSGAPVLLLNLISLVKQSGRYEVSVIVKRSGESDSSFASLANTLFIKPADYLQTNSILKKALQVVQSRIKILQCIFICFKADVIFSNTITNGRLLKILSITKKPVVTYIHELEKVAEIFDSNRDTSLSIEYSHLFLYPSSGVLSFLSVKYGIEKEKMKFLPYYFPLKQPPAQKKEKSKILFSGKYSVKFGNTLIVGMGTASYRKGVDIFVDTAGLVLKNRKDVSFIWIGDYENEEIRKEIQGRLAVINSADIIFTGKIPYDIYNLLPFDLFFLSSREDPYPLVVLEAAYLSIPTVCFADSGGITDFVNDETGWVVQDTSPVSAHEKLSDIIDNREDLVKKGKQARGKVIERHFNPEVTNNIFNDIIAKVKV